jgi:tetratricopeptide (TPR) repeat protein
VSAQLPAKFQRAFALHQGGQFARAQSLYEEILKLQPRHSDALHLLGLLAAQSSDPKRAVELIGRAIEIDPGNATAHCNRGSALQQLRQFDAALANYNQAIAIEGDFAGAYLNRGVVLQELGLLEAALASFDKAVEIKSDFAEAYFYRGNVQRGLQQFSAALASYHQAIAIRSDFVEAYGNRGNVLLEINRLEEALASYNQALALDAEYAEAHCNRAVASLLSGDLENGWPDFEWRWNLALGTGRKRTFSQPLWLGAESLEGKTILLHSEQGLGDSIQFCRYAELVSDLGAKVILEVQEPLGRLLGNLAGVSELLTKGQALPRFDCHCPLLSLPLAFKTTLDSIPSAARYLDSDAASVARWQAKLGERTKPRIGLTWSGSSIHRSDNRSIPLQDLLLQLPAGLQYVSLQKEVHDLDRRTLQANPHIWNFADALTDFSETAALCECMDMVVSIDTSVAHLSGALGKSTWILLAFNPDWRWLLDRNDSLWYPSLTLYRQASLGDWSGVLERVKADLTQAFELH